jgi:hypothetical protein
MADYLLIESRDPFDSNDVEFCTDLALRLAGQGETVTLFLVENGVLPARASPTSDRLQALAKAGVEVLADAFSLRERGIRADRLAAGVKAVSLDVVIDGMANGCKTLWH